VCCQQSIEANAQWGSSAGLRVARVALSPTFETALTNAG
jgi:hypothetical protein